MSIPVGTAVRPEEGVLMLFYLNTITYGLFCLMLPMKESTFYIFSFLFKQVEVFKRSCGERAFSFVTNKGSWGSNLL